MPSPNHPNHPSQPQSTMGTQPMQGSLRTSTALFAQQVKKAASTTTDADRDKTRDALFRTLDKDGNGTISFEEFDKVYDGIAQAVLEEHLALDQSKRRSKILCCVSLFLVGLVVFLMLGNAGLVYWLFKETRETKTAGATNGASTMLVSKDNAKVATGVAYTDMDLPSLVAAEDGEGLAHAAMITYLDAQNRTRTSAIDSYRFLSASDAAPAAREAAFYLRDGGIAHVFDDDVAVLPPPTAKASDATSIAEVAQICAQAACAADWDECVGYVSAVTDVDFWLHSVRCNGVPIFYYPELDVGGVVRENRRSLRCRNRMNWFHCFNRHKAAKCKAN